MTPDKEQISGEILDGVASFKYSDTSAHERPYPRTNPTLNIFCQILLHFTNNV